MGGGVLLCVFVVHYLGRDNKQPLYSWHPVIFLICWCMGLQVEESQQAAEGGRSREEKRGGEVRVETYLTRMHFPLGAGKSTRVSAVLKALYGRTHSFARCQ